MVGSNSNLDYPFTFTFGLLAFLQTSPAAHPQELIDLNLDYQELI